MLPLVSLLLAVSPLAAELDGPPAPAPRVAWTPTATVPADWFLDDGDLDSSAFAHTLFAASASGPAGAPVGLACEVTTPASFYLARLELRAKGVPWPVVATDSFVYVPVVPAGPPRVGVWRDNTHDKDVVGEVILGVMTLGLSVLRLNPTHVTTLTPGGKGAFRLACRTVGEASVDAVLASPQWKERCGARACHRDEAALRGPSHPDVRAHVQAAWDADAVKAAQWRRDARWALASLTVTGVAHCGPRCVRLTLRNDAPAPQPPFSSSEGLDANGEAVHFDFDGFPRPLGAGETKTLRASVRRLRDDGPPAFPVVLRTWEDFWFERVPGSFQRRGHAFTFGEQRCEGTTVRLAVDASRNAGSAAPDFAVLADGSRPHLRLPMFSDEREAEAWTSKCQPVLAVGGRTAGVLVLLP